jgi:amino acid permease
MLDGQALKWRILPSSLLWRLVSRTLLVLAICAVACAVPFFGVVLGFLGAISITPTTFMMPCALWLRLRPVTFKDWRLYFCWATLAVMSAVMVLGAVGAVRDFIREVIYGHGAKPFEW